MGNSLSACCSSRDAPEVKNIVNGVNQFISGPVVAESSEAYKSKPFVDGKKVFMNGEVTAWTGATEKVTAPIFVEGSEEKIVIGEVAQMDTETALKVLESVHASWDGGHGAWAQMTLEARCDAIENLVKKLTERKSQIVQVLMWEICKNTADATKEFDRTMEYIMATIAACKDEKMPFQSRQLRVEGGVAARIRRAPIGVMLNLGPFNYPFNETYATLIPALLMGNSVCMKVPTTGGLAHFLTMDAFASCLPKGTVGFVSGKGRLTMPPIMQSGKVDIFAFIGSSKAADSLIKQHPAPHRLTVYLGCDAKNLGIVTEHADLAVAAKECVVGSTTYNGQRCTAIKLMMVHRSVAEVFVPMFLEELSKLKAGLPWDKPDLTPLPEANKSEYIEGLMLDATSKGAKVLAGGEVRNKTLMTPAVVYPVNKTMKLWHEEQFGPAIPIAVYSSVDEIYDYLKDTMYGQQAAVFTNNPAASAPLLDVLEFNVGRVNVNTQCSRGPDCYPFGGRKSSALGTLSVTDALRIFSMDGALAAKGNDTNKKVLEAHVSGEASRKKSGAKKSALATTPSAAPKIEPMACPMEFVSKPCVAADSVQYKTKPFVDGKKVFMNGEITAWSGAFEKVTAPIFKEGETEKIVIGEVAQMDTETALKVLDAVVTSWNGGKGAWAQMTMEARCDALENLVKKLTERKAEIVQVLMWEICKNTADAQKEFDRTMEYITMTIAAAKDGNLPFQSRQLMVEGGVAARVRRAPIGVMLNLGPFNYPFNETYATLIPALLMGNSVCMKVPTTGGLAHFLTMDAFASCLPKGVVGFVSGKGRLTMPPLMQTGKVDIFAFIGSSKAADALIKQHPAPHRLTIYLGCDAKNLGIVTENADLSVAAKECVLGSTSYNGQRCTAIKLMMVHKSVVQKFVPKFLEELGKLKAGLPWDKADLTPLPEANKSDYIQSLVDDATSKGATVLAGGEVREKTLMTPAVVYPVTKEMKLWHEEQFGPAIPIAVYSDVAEIYDYLKDTMFGQQAAVFTNDAAASAELLDVLEVNVGRVNVNTQCSRGPDTYPFGGRKSSALGTLSVQDALRIFSIDSALAAKGNDNNKAVLNSYMEAEASRKK